ncbi:hypothetical protein COCC4DRAFT_133211 [Bipolaris maydis ATCC 48331]|uniref:Uncharacterized protein n=2 Tax=Cochliobolus heterostrophus TaxID=5016 RepID=M2UIA3_COCH5|nr:uncharacterized protein COCC4DRAFT_133211 [Bipolaris maydis ATCC 48331]EMD93396.1 hypothetical protein COCHEDRAFT_1212111 [Bipolaris maydis C5]KAJ5027718.1 hypothetical protein J3E73DRAFT_368114 [Bipolaris maydis]ENI07156.1 hypothetical protein COCC4DRAFT_133211 [Bipolaris maydis ATCC 48331]KAJ5062473.1 hypothetical protein J3E74DRAFT_404124 [Bipolaris maydis]KAJ6198749.1 hypothetical protein J3E72DRAFT_373234 [Bipolaris maydis]
MKYFIILLSAIATASALAVPEAQPESLDKRQKCYTAYGACITACPGAACPNTGATDPEFCC